MILRKILILGAVALGAVIATGGVAAAGYIMVDNFDGLELGPIEGQNEWRAPADNSAVTLDPENASNQVLSVLTESTYLTHPTVVPEGEARMFFLRFRYEEQLSVSFGLTQSAFPTQFGDFDVELSLTSTRDELRINDDGTYKELITLEDEHWYNCWLYVDNAADVSSIWLHDRPGEAATAADQLAIDGSTEFPFRTIASTDLKSFFIKTGGGDGVAGPLILDDLYLQNAPGVDLSYPPEVAAVVEPHRARMQLREAWPNPFNPQTTISFTLDESQPIELSVYDVSGRLVRQLDSGVREAGTHAISWDGRDRTGAGVASGIYLVRLSGRQEAQTKKILLAQ